MLFLPDRNLGEWVRKQTGRENMQIWQGTCIVHDTFPARRVVEAKTEHPRAQVVAHPECPESVLAMADFVGSTSAIIEWCAASAAARVHRHDRKRRALFAGEAVAAASASGSSPTKTAIAASAPT